MLFQPRYRYNPDNCNYERVRTSPKQMVVNTVWLVTACLLTAAAAYGVFRISNPGMEEIALDKTNKALRSAWNELNLELASVREKLKKIEQEDDDHYRIVLNMPKLSPEIRKGGSGGHEVDFFPQLSRFDHTRHTGMELVQLKNRIRMQEKSYVEIRARITRSEGMLDSRPALQPLDNRQITRFHPKYGMRVHPLFNDYRFHHGLDLTADTGTPVYASGDGLVTHVKYSGGYGNVIFINHGYGFETRYAHLSKFKATEGQKVKRGELIGYVGTTGNSTGPHLHYEVLFKGEWVNPIHFLYRDMRQGHYNEIIRSARE